MAPRRTPSERTDLVRAWRSSGLTIEAFCKLRRIPKTSLLRWVGQVGPTDALTPTPPSAPSPSFVRLEVVRASRPLLVEAGKGRIVVEHGFDAALLRVTVHGQNAPQAEYWTNVPY